MKVAIVEICEPNHYTAVKALGLTYASDLQNEVSIYTLAHFKTLDTLVNNANIQLIKKTEAQTILEFLEQINDAGFNTIHINTVSKYYSHFAAVNWKNLVLTVHNIDIWFNNPLNNQFALLKYRVFNTKGNIKQTFYLPIKYFTKEYFWQKQRVKMLTKIISQNQKVLVYSEAQKKTLSKYLSAKQVVVFPFCVREVTADLSVNNKFLRVCIPGSVDNHRRDYDGLFELLKKNHLLFANQICFDLLGYIPKTETTIIPQIKELEKLGIQIIYNQNFIDDKEYNERLQLCDVILGNLQASLNHQSKYGETKETGVVFNMIKAAKPGIFPNFYPVEEILKPICLLYSSDLEQLLLGLIKDNTQLHTLKQKAIEISKFYEPQYLYPKLIKQILN
ncbi:hypothetical protein [Pedobacter alpinus]|uniref:Uncharacterized protein n=1 Tax=Pedobacter alpinus TaxID=1590643 RepID=A0ABW5TT49_9SPHI